MAKGRPKRVRFWVMEPVEDLGFEPNDEVDEVRWVTTAEAEELLTYERDRCWQRLWRTDGPVRPTGAGCAPPCGR